MKLSFFRSRSSDVSSAKKENKLRHMLSPGRSKSMTLTDLEKPSVSSPRLEIPVDQDSVSNGSVAAKSYDGAADSDLPSLPSESDPIQSPARNAASHAPSDTSAIDERDMHRRLMDVESSFLPDPSPVASKGRSHSAGNWAVFGATRSPHDSVFVPKTNQDRSVSDIANTDDSAESTSLPKPSVWSPNLFGTSSKTASRRARYDRSQNGNDSDYGDATFDSYLQDYTQSSPVAAAAARSKFRAVSALDGKAEPAPAPFLAPKTPTPERLASPVDEMTPKQPGTTHRVDSSLDQPSTPKIEKAQTDVEKAVESGDDAHDEVAPLPTQTQQPTENTVHNHRRQMSSISSMANRSELSADAFEDTNGADYALQSGGAVSTANAAQQHSREISRVPSFGSIASSMSAQTEATSRRAHKRGLSETAKVPVDKNLGSLEENVKMQSSPITPRPGPQHPSDTVLARHVRDIQVPNTIAKDFREAYQETQSKSSVSTPFTSRAKNGLTLKEQNSKVDKLSKENFDLKLKIHYLSQALQNHSEEGVKDLISTNAQLQADLVKSKKEVQTLRRQLREMERQQGIRGDGLSAAVYSNQDESEDDVSSRGFRHGQMEDEIVYLRDRLQYYEDDANKTREESDALRLELARLKQAQAGRTTLGTRDLSSPVRSHLRISDDPQDLQDTASLSGTTATDQLKHENAELRRNLGAQTSMLTSRNRERERLQQMVEDLKLQLRRGDGVASNAGDSILDRSVSQAYHRPTSRASGATRDSLFSDADRDQLERRYATIRDENATLRLRNQDLQRNLDSLSTSLEDLQALQAERDDALQLLDDTEQQSEAFKENAMKTIDGLEELIEDREQEIANLARELDAREDVTNALRLEIKGVSESLISLADEREASQNQIQNLEQELTSANQELEALEKGLREVSIAKERLEVQAESSQSEIAFLREEQEGDKIKIGDLDSALRNAKNNLKDGEERFREFEQLQTEVSQSKEVVRQLKTALSLKEIESNSMKDKLEELEHGLRTTFSDFQGPRTDLLREVMKRQRDLENTTRDLDVAKYDLGEKERILKDRENLLESGGLENRKMSDLLEKERQARRHEQEAQQRALSSNNPVARLAEVELARTLDRKKIGTIEQKHSEQLRERNTVLFSLWTRLSDLCGPGWPALHDINRDPAAISKALSQDLPTFNKNLVLALSTIEGVVQGFPSKIRNTEKVIEKDFRNLESALTTRSKRIEQLEKAVKAAHAAAASSSSDNNGPTPTDLKSLKDENKSLRREIRHLKQGTWFALPGLPTTDLDGASDRHSRKDRRSRDRRSHVSPSPSRGATPAVPHPHLLAPTGRHYSSSALEAKTSAAASAAAIALQQQQAGAAAPSDAASALSASASGDADHARLTLQLKELQRRLKAEREGRLLDRDGARKRLEEGRAENEGLRRELNRVRVTSGDEADAE